MQYKESMTTFDVLNELGFIGDKEIDVYVYHFYHKEEDIMEHIHIKPVDKYMDVYPCDPNEHPEQECIRFFYTDDAELFVILRSIVRSWYNI